MYKVRSRPVFGVFFVHARFSGKGLGINSPAFAVGRCVCWASGPGNYGLYLRQYTRRARCEVPRTLSVTSSRLVGGIRVR